jgi:Alpha amylase, catalytic domain
VSERGWRDAVLYQVYPRSFADANGDGIGDLAGVAERLEYLEWLGVDATWLNPVHPSPNVDWGYDVADYTGIHPDLGTLDDLDRLVAAAGARGIRVVLDLVPNGDQLDLAFAFMLTHANLDAEEMRRVVAEIEAALPAHAWPCWAGSNHDIGRLATRWANGDDARARCALLLLLTLRGTPCLYYGDELALTSGAVSDERVVDCATPSRDPGRTPMPWTPEGGWHGPSRDRPDPRCMPRVDGDDARRSLQRGLREVRRLPVVRGDGELLELGRLLGETGRARDSLPEGEARCGPRLRSQRAAYELDVLALVGRCDIRELGELAGEGASGDRPLVERRSELLPDERVVEDLHVARLRGPRQPSSRRTGRENCPKRERPGVGDGQPQEAFA